MFPSGVLQLTVKGLVRLEKLSPFFEELRSASRHRTLSLVLLRAPPASSPSASSLLGKVHFNQIYAFECMQAEHLLSILTCMCCRDILPWTPWHLLLAMRIGGRRLAWSRSVGVAMQPGSSGCWTP